jgi:cytochrome c oxidase subunit 3
MATVDPHVTAPPAATPPVSRGSQMSMGMLAMVFFLGSEAMLFASFFTAYFFVRYNVADQWPPLNADGEPFELPILITGINTAILVASSFTLHWGEHMFKHHGDRVALRRGLIVTIMLGATFLIIQINEYAHLGFTPQDQMFGTIFYCLTGLHGAHVFVGLNALFYALNRARAGEFSHGHAGPLQAASIYWHFVDVVWVFLFVVVYLV